MEKGRSSLEWGGGEKGEGLASCTAFFSLKAKLKQHSLKVL